MHLIALALPALFSSASAATHHSFVGTFGTAVLYTLEFDDVQLSLKLIQNDTASQGHSWITFDHDKRNVYGVAGSAVPSYSIQNDTSLQYDTSIATGGDCSSVNEIFVAAAQQSPYTVYTTPSAALLNARPSSVSKIMAHFQKLCRILHISPHPVSTASPSAQTRRISTPRTTPQTPSGHTRSMRQPAH